MERSGIAATALLEAVAVIDRELGDGYAAAHPEILQKYMTISGMELRSLKSGKASANPVSATKQKQIELVSRFMSCATEPAPLTQIQARVLYNAFIAWCRRSGHGPFSEVAFCRSLQSLGYTRFAGRIRFWLDLKLKDDTDT